VPLSEEELRLLEQMERALVEEDPKLASTLRGTTMRRQARRQLVLAIAFFVIGVAVLMTGAVIQETVVGIIGFVIMLGSAYLGLSAWRGKAPAATYRPGSPEQPAGLTVIQGGKKPRKISRTHPQQHSGSLMDRFEERWRRRRDRDQGF
jgi:Protein of unknown function (DUF3040)